MWSQRLKKIYAVNPVLFLETFQSANRVAMIKCVPESSAGTHGGLMPFLVFEDTAAVPMVSPRRW